MKNLTIFIPSHNNSRTITQFLAVITKIVKKLPYLSLSVLVVDMHSTDDTYEKIISFAKNNSPIVHFRNRNKSIKYAYKKGYQFALNILNADAVITIKPDFSYDPNAIIPMVRALTPGVNVVLGARDEKNISLGTKIRSFLTRIFFNVSSYSDAFTSFYALTRDAIRCIDFSECNPKGINFSIDLFIQLKQSGLQIVEIPVSYIKNTNNISPVTIEKISVSIRQSIMAHFGMVPSLQFILAYFSAGLITGFLWYMMYEYRVITIENLVIFFYALFSIGILAQGLFNIYLMLHIWDNPLHAKEMQLPKKLKTPYYTFSAIIPARHEEQVIADTIKTVAAIDYPESKKEIIIVTSYDDYKTNLQAELARQMLPKANIKIVSFFDTPINKPHGLNVGLANAKNTIVVVFDAEDEPHKDIYKIANTLFLTKQLDVLQSGVQLMNLHSNWFSALNVLEYFFWFKSILPFFAKNNFVPLAGNTVFFKRSILTKINGWDETKLTEDAEIGLRLSMINAKTHIVYDEHFTTREETPHSVASFIKQRTRWKQGFLQIFFSGEWKELVGTQKKMLAAYVFGFPLIELSVGLYLIFSIIVTSLYKIPLIITILSILPGYVVLLQLFILVIGTQEFIKKYHIDLSKFFPLIVFITIIPYMAILFASVIRAIWRHVTNNANWEKTLHINQHRKAVSA